MDSDSDDEILTSRQKFDDLFSRKIRPPPPAPPKPSRSALKDKTGRAPTISASSKKEQPEKKLKTESKVTKDTKKKKPIISDDTKNFLAELELDDIVVKKPLPKATTTSVGNSTASCALPSAPVPPVPTPNSPKQSKSTRGRRGRPPTRRSKRSKKSETIEVSDDDECVPINDSSNLSFSSSFMEESPKVELCTIRCQWKEEVLRFNVSQGSRMSQIRMLLAEKLDARPDSLLILNKDLEVPDVDTVESIPIGVTLEVFEKEANKNEKLSLKTLKPGYILINLQGSGGYRQRFPVAIKKTTHMKQVVDDYIEKFGFQGKNFRLMLDGETIDLTETPETLDLENNDMIDIVEVVQSNISD